MYALMEKIPINFKDSWKRNAEYHHHKVLSAFPDEETAQISRKIWTGTLNWYHPDVLTVMEIPKNTQVGTTLTLYGMMMSQMEIDKGYATGPGKIRPYDRSNTLKDDSIKVKFVKKGSSLLTGDYEIVPEGGIILVYHRTYQEETQEYNRSLVAKIDGYSQVKGVYRAKREVQYLTDEPEERETRITRGLIPIITPEGIVLSRVVRPEVPLMECSA